MSEKVIAYIGLGSNLQEPFEQIKNALTALRSLEKSELLTDSGYYTSTPMGPQDQPDYVNAVARMVTTLEPLTLLACLQSIEKRQGRVRHQRWHARTLDLDLLLYGNCIINEAALTVPHPGICERDFVYLPLLSIDKDVAIPAKGRLRELVSDNETEKSTFGAKFVGRIELFNEAGRI